MSFMGPKVLGQEEFGQGVPGATFLGHEALGQENGNQLILFSCVSKFMVNNAVTRNMTMTMSTIGLYL